MKTRRFFLILLGVYILFFFFMAVLSRITEPEAGYRMKSDLFWGYDNPEEDIVKDNIINIACFVPIGILVGLIARRHRLLYGMLVGFLTSLAIECTQLMWQKGVFDVDDLFNNTAGALIGGLIALLILGFRREL